MKEHLPTEKNNFIWNMIGSGVYALSSMILSYLTIRITGPETGGVFSIGLTLAQMFVYIVYFETRNYQVTDAKDQFSFGEYHAVKLLNSMVMVLVVAVYLFARGYSAEKSWIVFGICLYRMLDGYADVYESEYHKRERLDLAGKSMTYRTILSVLVYFLLLVGTGQLTVATIGAIVSGVIGIILFDVLPFSKVGKISIQMHGQAIVGILRHCFPMFLGMFLWTYLLSASRIAVDRVMTGQDQSYYQVLFLPVSVINLFAGFLIRPLLLDLTDLFSNRNMKKFWSKIGKVAALIVGFTLFCMAGAYLCGIPVLEILAGCDLKEYRSMFVFLIFSGGINALAILLYYVLVIFRAEKAIIAGYACASAAAFIIAVPLTRKNGLWGASASYLISVAILFLIFTVCSISVTAQSGIREMRTDKK